MFTAEKGKGARLNGVLIKVSGRTYPQCMVEFDGLWAYDRPGVRRNFEAIASKFHRHFRLFGSLIHSSLSVASGDTDGHLGFLGKPWDFAPGILLVTEAGGIATDFKGSKATTSTRNTILSAIVP
ncbi:hypothetical protein HYY74_08150 [Candidatus Woesearchaeota archaeon]|nr:hypothetical protein [Candidatus Woesearchaeota archaeon]